MKINDDDKEESEVSLKKINSDIIRGMYGPYLAFNDDNDLFGPATTVNIYIPEYSETNIDTYFNIRMQDNSTYSSISDRIDINEKNGSLSVSVGHQSQEEPKEYILYRGDCYICQFTHRVNRNFNDPSAPYNSEIVDKNSWKDNYDPSNVESCVNINLGDVNAV
jgi:hypothetical protein